MKTAFQIRRFGPVQCLQGSIYRFGRKFTYCCYYIDGLLIDTGPPCARKDLQKFIKTLHITGIVITHYHEDHTGNAAWISKERNVPVYMNPATAIKLGQAHIPLYRKLIWGHLETISSLPLHNELKTNHFHFSIVETPGHSEDHITIVEEDQKWLFSGDLFLGRRLLYGMRNESVPQLIESIDKVVKYNFDTLFCGHVGIVEDGKEGLLAKKEYLQWLMQETLDLKKEGYSLESITEKLLPSQRLVSWFSRGEMSPMHLISSIVEQPNSKH
ncbi:MBL fold metallo-hydrolase [Bacillus alkalicellulosilyticus]|uniref:MBL fold metallo-hydrolase n=1 Tax=Alkalihalobacterium alkalicellulosilyticum TaxID=1912214 RepID=UPI0009966C94|nr:MBL fold metallo-hydrolase [Bacillus alkalicellulosilyticus]